VHESGFGTCLVGGFGALRLLVTLGVTMDTEWIAPGRIPPGWPGRNPCHHRCSLHGHPKRKTNLKPWNHGMEGSVNVQFADR
jgi:hypothetical protein